MKFEGREIDDQIIAACRQRISENGFERKDLLAIIRSFRLPPDLAERIAENLIHEAGTHGEIAGKVEQDESIRIPKRKKSPTQKTASAIDSKTVTTKSKRKPLLPSAQLDLFAGI